MKTLIENRITGDLMEVEEPEFMADHILTCLSQKDIKAYWYYENGRIIIDYETL